MLLCAGDELYADPSSLVGSIGVITQGFGIPKVLKKLDIEPRTYTAGSAKVKMSPLYDENKNDILTTRDRLDVLHKEFIDLVKTARGDKLVKKTTSATKKDQDSQSGEEGASIRPNPANIPKSLGESGLHWRHHLPPTGSDLDEELLFNGDIWAGREAMKLGLIDNVGFLDDVIAEKFGPDVTLRAVKKPKPFLAKILNPDDDDMDAGAGGVGGTKNKGIIKKFLSAL